MLALCLLVNSLTPSYYQFCKSLLEPDIFIYICVDKPPPQSIQQDNDNRNNKSHSNTNMRGTIEIIQINKQMCEEEGFKGCVTYFPETYACSRDKALFYFCRINQRNHPKIWFIEEDVFFYSLNTIRSIDEKYPHADLLSSNNNIKKNKKVNWQNKWHWPRIFSQARLPPPYATSMICAIRVSQKLLKCLDQYVRVAKSLFVDEALFNTISLHAKLVTRTPDELSSIKFRKDWKKEEIGKENLYHPIKSVARQFELRRNLSTQ